MANKENWLDVLSLYVDKIDNIVWGAPLIFTILATGIFLTFFLKFRHIANIGNAFRFMFHNDDGHHGEVSPFAALCTSLSSTIGTGNIIGVTTAICTGGPGALFWMVVAAFFGMATKYAESLLAVKYRKRLDNGRILGGPFHYIENGLGPKWKPLAVIFAVFGIIAGMFGTGTFVQIHGITSSVQRVFDPSFDSANLSSGVVIFGTAYSPSAMIAGAVITLCTALVVIGGLKRIAKVSMVIVPFMAASYIVLCLLILLGNLEKIPGAVSAILKAAFDPAAFTGGAVGSLFVALQKGVARGIFSNEAGLGTEPIAAATARTNEPVKQALVSMTGVFLDTIIICSMTGLAIMVSGAYDPATKLEGINLTVEAFVRGLAFLPHGKDIAPFLLMSSLIFLAFTTILGWNFYTERCLEYLIGSNRRKFLLLFRAVYVALVFIGPYLTISVVWGIADISNGLMAFPNLIALIFLAPAVSKTTSDFFERQKK
jgi:AGCS family alanine or glycine:cation symporter